MNILLRNVTIVQPGSPSHLQQVDVWIKSGKVESLGKKVTAEKETEIIDCTSNFLSPGWLDFRSNLCDPGFEDKEDLASGLEAAASGGFTAVMTLPNTSPVVDSKSIVEYILRKSKGSLVDVFPCAAITHGGEGKHIAELYDMHRAGAVAFSDGERALQDAGTLVRALQYVKPLDRLIINKPEERSMSSGGMMNESEASVLLGMKTIPSVAEELMVMRDLKLAEYTGCKIMIGPVSTKGSVDLIRNAKDKGLQVQCFVSTIHLLLDDSHLASFDSNFKIDPPLRTAEDIEALKKGIQDGTIDICASGHSPQNIELKQVEFDYAAFGMISLQTSFAAAVMALENRIDVTRFVELFCLNPRRALNVSIPKIEEGESVNATLFSLDQHWTYTAENNKSKSFNSPMIGTEAKGKPLMVFNNNLYYYC